MSTGGAGPRRAIYEGGEGGGVCLLSFLIYKQLFDTWNRSDWWLLLDVVFWLSIYWLLFFELGLVFLGWRFFVPDFRATD